MTYNERIKLLIDEVEQEENRVNRISLSFDHRIILCLSKSTLMDICKNASGYNPKIDAYNFDSGIIYSVTPFFPINHYPPLFNMNSNQYLSLAPLHSPNLFNTLYFFSHDDSIPYGKVLIRYWNLKTKSWIKM